MFEIRTHHRGENIPAAYSKLLQEKIQSEHIYGSRYSAASLETIKRCKPANANV
jgi:hypothetical protein